MPEHFVIAGGLIGAGVAQRLSPTTARVHTWNDLDGTVRTVAANEIACALSPASFAEWLDVYRGARRDEPARRAA